MPHAFSSEICGNLRNLWIILLTLLFSLPALAADQPARLRITVDAADHDRIDTPVIVDLKDTKLLLPTGPITLQEIKDNRRIPIPSQIDSTAGKKLYFILTGNTPKNTKRTFELVPDQTWPLPPAVLQKTDKTLDAFVNKAQVFRYNQAIVPAPEGKKKLFDRGGFFHPLYSPSGQVLTTIHPADHIHHFGLWNPWTNTTFEGRHVDFWNVGDGTGTVRFVKFDSTTNGPAAAAFRARLDHVVLKTADNPQEKTALNETLDIRVWNVGGPGPGDKGYFIMDFTTTQRCASNSPLKLNQYRYGGFGFRAVETWTRDVCNILTSEGKTRKDGNHTRARWVNVFGPTPKGTAGIIFFSHPQNREHPEPIRIWPDTEKYFFFNYSPTVQKEWILEPNTDYTLQYRLYIYDGQTTPQTAERLWQDFAHPPKVTIE